MKGEREEVRGKRRRCTVGIFNYFRLCVESIEANCKPARHIDPVQLSCSLPRCEHLVLWTALLRCEIN